jgi:hypothetical protein
MANKDLSCFVLIRGNHEPFSRLQNVNRGRCGTRAGRREAILVTIPLPVDGYWVRFGDVNGRVLPAL